MKSPNRPFGNSSHVDASLTSPFPGSGTSGSGTVFNLSVKVWVTSAGCMTNSGGSCGVAVPSYLKISTRGNASGGKQTNDYQSVSDLGRASDPLKAFKDFLDASLQIQCAKVDTFDVAVINELPDHLRCQYHSVIFYFLVVVLEHRDKQLSRKFLCLEPTRMGSRSRCICGGTFVPVSFVSRWKVA